jgi:hypothetical protein
MTGLDWRVRPIERWLGPRTQQRKRSPFGIRGKVDWSGTTDLLVRELRMLAAKDVILQMQVTEADIRMDGWIYAGARPQGPGVILSFESKHGPLSYPCDTYTDWQANVRAIALGLEALRKVSRYGVGVHGEQYRGWKALPAAISGGPHAILARHAGVSEDDVRRNPTKVYRLAARAAHPDAGGTGEAWAEVQGAARALGVG